MPGNLNQERIARILIHRWGIPIPSIVDTSKRDYHMTDSIGSLGQTSGHYAPT